MNSMRISHASLISGVVLVLLAASLRLLAARGDLWLDEIWTLELLKNVTAPYEIFWSINHDNNHYLNSLYLYLIGQTSVPLTYRLLSVLTGTATVVVAGLVGRRRGTSTMLVNMAVMGLSYPMVHYASEARGFAPMMLFALLAYHWLDLHLAGRQGRHRYWFAMAVALGILSHLTMVMVAASLGMWTFHVLFLRTGSLRDAALGLVRFFLPAFLMSIAIGATILAGAHFGGYVVGGGVLHKASYMGGLGTSIADLLLLVLGVDYLDAVWKTAAFLCVYTIFIVYYIGKYRQFDEIFLIISYCLAFLLMTWSLAPSLFPRYLLFIGVMTLLLFGRAAAALFDAGRLARVVSCAAVLLFSVGNTTLLMRFFEAGRGQYSEAVQYMLAHTLAPTLTVAGNHYFQNWAMLDYYVPRLADDRALSYVTPQDRPEWYINRGLRRVWTPEPCVVLDTRQAEPTSYRLARHFSYWGLSGYHWALYRQYPGGC